MFHSLPYFHERALVAPLKLCSRCGAPFIWFYFHERALVAPLKPPFFAQTCC